MKLIDNLFRGSLVKKLFLAVKEHDLDTAQAMLERGAPAESRDESGETPLHRLMGAGASNPTQLITANVPERKSIAELLIRHGAQVNSRDNDGETPLHKAAESGHVDAARILLDLGADVSAADHYGRTALHPAIFFRRHNLTRLLLEHGADPNVRDRGGQSLLKSAEPDETLMEMLREFGARE